MSRSLSYLRRGLLGIAFVGSLGFGATQAFARGPVLDTIPCEYGHPDADWKCTEFCRSRNLYGGGWCTVYGTCECNVPVEGWPG